MNAIKSLVSGPTLRRGLSGVSLGTQFGSVQQRNFHKPSIPPCTHHNHGVGPVSVVPPGYKMTVVNHNKDIPVEHKDSVIGDFLRVYRGEASLKKYETGELLVITCIDLRLKVASVKELQLYLMRVAGANALGSEVSIAVPLSAGVRNVLVLTHTDCLMSEPDRDAFTQGMVKNLGWNMTRAAAFFDNEVAPLAIHNPIEFSATLAQKLRRFFADEDGKTSLNVVSGVVLTRERRRPIGLITRESGFFKG